MGSSTLTLLTVMLSASFAATLFPSSTETVREGEFESVLEGKMPIQQTKRGGSVSVRMYQDLYVDYPEFWFSLHSEAVGMTVSAAVRAPEGQSIFKQLEALRKARPNITLEKLTEAVKVKQWDQDSESCPALEGSPWDFPTATKHSQIIILHPMALEIGFDLSTIGGTLWTFDDEQQPVVWALAQREILETCVIHSDPTAFFLRRGTRSLTANRFSLIRAFIQSHIEHTEDFGILETIRTDLDQDGTLDFLFLYRKYEDQQGDQPAEVFLGTIAEVWNPSCSRCVGRA